MLSATISVPPVEPPRKKINPMPEPFKIPPKTAARIVSPEYSGRIGAKTSIATETNAVAITVFVRKLTPFSIAPHTKSGIFKRKINNPIGTPNI